MLDSNIVISALVFNGPERRLLSKLVSDGNGIISEDIGAETNKFVERETSPTSGIIETFKHIEAKFCKIPRIEYESGIAEQGEKIRDKNDAHVLAAFKASKADFLVTGDKDLLSLGLPKIITTRKALEILATERN